MFKTGHRYLVTGVTMSKYWGTHPFEVVIADISPNGDWVKFAPNPIPKVFETSLTYEWNKTNSLRIITELEAAK